MGPRSRNALGVCTLLTVLAPSFAWAAFTTVLPAPTGEDSQSTMLSHIYGNTFTPTISGGHDYSNGTIVATRIEDEGGSSGLVVQQDSGPLNGTDQLWQGAYQQINAK